jgi:hypothetical protein
MGCDSKFAKLPSTAKFIFLKFGPVRQVAEGRLKMFDRPKNASAARNRLGRFRMLEEADHARTPKFLLKGFQTSSTNFFPARRHDPLNFL